METEGIKFFIKFNLTDEYADSLINSGEIYTNCAKYYIYQKEYENKEGIGDDKEGLLFGFIRTNTHLPLYCMYEVNDANLISYNGKCYVKINKLMIDHFAGLVLTEFPDMEFVYPEFEPVTGGIIHTVLRTCGEITEEKTEDFEPVTVREEKTEKACLNLNKPYEEMSVEELQEAILCKMRKNGPVTDYMLGTVRENTHHGSLVNWVKSFNN